MAFREPFARLSTFVVLVAALLVVPVVVGIILPQTNIGGVELVCNKV